MAESSFESLQSLKLRLEKAKLPDRLKNALLKNHQANLMKETHSENSNPSDTKTFSSGCQNEVDSFSPSVNFSEVKGDELRSTSGIQNVHSSIFYDESDAVSNEHDMKYKNLDKILDLADEEDLLCQISMKKSETDSDSDGDLPDYDFSSNFQEFDPKQMVNNKLSLFEKQKVPALQIGLAVPEPVLNVEEAKFSKNVLRILKEIQFYGPSCIQSVAWPAVERGRDVFVVAPPRSGKTVSYVLPLVSRFASRGTTVEENRGPHTIILCSSWRKAQYVNDCFKLFLGDMKKKIFTLYTDGGHYQKKMQFLINSCDILIATPHCLCEFFQRKMISFSRLDEFVLDDGSIVMEKHKKELKEIFLCIMEAIKKTECSPQLILCTDRWNKNFQIIVDKIMRNPLLLFTSFLEAAIYAKIPISAHVCESKRQKYVIICGIIKKSSCKVVICTASASEAFEVHRYLKCVNFPSYLVNEDMEHYVADDVIKSWKCASTETGSHCLIITDQILSDMCISNADCLIHFDIPPISRLQFGNRFSTIAEHFTREESRESSSKCVCYVLVLESERNCTSNLVEIIENSGGTPSEKLIELSKMPNKDENVSGDLCHYMKAFGVCTVKRCNYRHIIVPKIDQPEVVPCEGDVHGIVTHILDASHYYVRLVKYLDPISNKTVSLIGAYAKIGFQLRNSYIHSSEEIKVDTPVVGESYVIEEENKLFYRVKILGFIPETSTHVAQWRILFLDEGWIKCCKTPKLFKLDDKIDLPKPFAVEVYACNMAPPDSSFDWNPQTSQLVSDLIKGKEIHGKIVLCIGNTLWLDPLALTVRLSDGNYVYPFKIDQKLLDYGHIIKRKNHLELLFKACTGKISFPHVTKPKAKEEKIEKSEPSVNYAFLDCDVYEDVYVSSVVSPDHLYVQRAKFVDCLDDLLDKINDQVKNRKLKKAYTIFQDMVCVAPFFEDNRYYRAIVTDILSDIEVRVFFVDFGDSGTVARKDIYFLSAEFLLLPFQAIECELAGISAPHGGWTESAISSLIALTRNEDSDMKIVQLKAYSKTSSYSKGNHYVVDLWDNKKKITELLLQAGFCVPVESSTQVPNDSLRAQCNNEMFDFDEKCSTSSDDEDMDPEDKEITAQFYGVVAKMLAEEYDLFPLPKEPNAGNSDDEEEILKQCKSISLPASNIRQNNVEKILPKLNQIKEILPLSESSSNSFRPLITWWDTPIELNIFINLKDIKVYELDVTDESLRFNTFIAGNQYSTEEKLYEKIISCDVQTSQTVQGISIVAKKCTPFKWPRLTKEKKKFLHIKYDFIHIEDSDSEDSDKEKSKIKEDMRYAYEDEDGDTTDEDEKYVEPWKEFARNKDPVGDMLAEI